MSGPTSAMAQHHDGGYRGGYGDEVLGDRGHGYREPEPYYRHSEPYAYSYTAYPAHQYERPYRYDRHQIGRAPCRERGCTYVYISGGAVSLKKNKTNNSLIHNKH